MAESVIKKEGLTFITLTNSDFPYTPTHDGIMFARVENGGTGTVTVKCTQASRNSTTVTSTGAGVELAYPCVHGKSVAIDITITGGGVLYHPEYFYIY